MNPNEKQLPSEAVIEDAELATAQGGAAIINWQEIVDRLKNPSPVPPLSPTWPAPAPEPQPFEWVPPQFR